MADLIGAKILVRQNEGGVWSLAAANEDGEEGTVRKVEPVGGVDHAYIAVRGVGGGTVALLAVPASQLAGKVSAPAPPAEEE